MGRSQWLIGGEKFEAEGFEMTIEGEDVEGVNIR